VSTLKILEDLTAIISKQTSLCEEILSQLPLHHPMILNDEGDDDMLLDGSEPLANEEIN
jgi:hypothetical protein